MTGKLASMGRLGLHKVRVDLTRLVLAGISLGALSHVLNTEASGVTFVWTMIGDLWLVDRGGR